MGSDKLYIDNSTTSTPLIWGDFLSREVIVNGTVGAVSFYNTSDRNLKKEIETLEGALAMVLDLRAVTFKWDTSNPDLGNLNEGSQVGVIAQEVEKIIPELVTERPDGYKGVSYGQLSAVLVEAIKEQQSLIDKQEHIITDLSRRIELLEGK